MLNLQIKYQVLKNTSRVFIILFLDRSIDCNRYYYTITNSAERSTPPRPCCNEIWEENDTNYRNTHLIKRRAVCWSWLSNIVKVKRADTDPIRLRWCEEDLSCVVWYLERIRENPDSVKIISWTSITSSSSLRWLVKARQ